MKTKEKKTNIEVNIYGTRFSVVVPFSEQDAVRATETQMKAYLKGLREIHSTKSPAECMAMMAYHYASNFFALNARMEAETAEAEDLLRDAERLCEGIESDATEDSGINRSEFGEF
ncbi:MAG: cell division protein ZapA [Muribaculaceae bacterium]|nr:cell division protein ZapA [Muribaculaceae bacterium]